MIELIVSTVTFLGFFLMFFFCVPFFKFYKVIIFYFLIVFTIVMYFIVNDIFYKKHYLWNIDENIETTNENEEYDKSNPFTKLKNYSKYSDIICIVLSLSCFIFSICEPNANRMCSIFSIIDWIFTIINAVLFLIRYLLFIKIKNFYNEYEDGYPRKYFNYDSIPISILIAMILFYILYLITPMKCHCCYKDDTQNNNTKKYPCFNSDDDDTKIKNRVCLILFPINFFFIIFFIFDILNDNRIKNNYDKIYNNWELSPIKIITSHNYYNFTYSFEYERFTKYNYYNILEKNGKICGKDNKGNDLYFPDDEECPINDIYISEVNEAKPDYIIKNIDNKVFLYYTNQNIEGKIIIDVEIINENNKYKLNITNYEGIDINLKSYLNENFKKNMKKFKSLIVPKYVLFGFSILFIIYFIILLIFEQIKHLTFLIISIFFLVIIFVYLIILSICMNINKKYVQNFMNKIDMFQNKKCSYIFNLILTIILIYFIIYDTIILLYKFLLNNDCSNIKKLCEKKEEVKEPGPEPKPEPEPEPEPIPPSPKKDNECIICMTNPPTIILAPCGHRCYCASCYESTKSKLNECPICRKTIEAVINQVYEP